MYAMCRFEERQVLKFSIYDWDSKSPALKAHDFLGRQEKNVIKICIAAFLSMRKDDIVTQLLFSIWLTVEINVWFVAKYLKKCSKKKKGTVRYHIRLSKLLQNPDPELSDLDPVEFFRIRPI
jgi:hypothetical protein